MLACRHTLERIGGKREGYGGPRDVTILSLNQPTLLRTARSTRDANAPHVLARVPRLLESIATDLSSKECEPRSRAPQIINPHEVLGMRGAHDASRNAYAIFALRHRIDALLV